MPILEEYRKPNISRARGYRGAVMLAALLVLVLVVIVRMGRQNAPPTPPSGEPEISASAPVALSSPTQPWEPLSPDEERALLEQIVDQAPIGLREHREAYYYLLAKVHHLTDAEIAAALDTEIRYADFAGQPAIVRGSIVGVRGILLRLQSVQLTKPPDSGPAIIYEGQIMDGDTPEHIYSFALTEPPQSSLQSDRVSMSDAIRVTLRGIFMQNIVYQNQQNPPELVATPLIIGRRLEKTALPNPRPAPTSPLWFITLAIFAAIIALRLFLFTGPSHSRKSG